jgi:hypothetical protein
MAFLKGNWLLTLEAADLVHFVWGKVCLHFVLNARVTSFWPNSIFNYKKCHFAQSNLFVDKIIAGYSLQYSTHHSYVLVVHTLRVAENEILKLDLPANAINKRSARFNSKNFVFNACFARISRCGSRAIFVY